MARYTVHIRREGPESLTEAQFVRDGFSWAAFTFGPLWLLAKGAWISALLQMVTLIALGLLLNGLGVVPLFPLVALVLGILVGLESGAIRAWEAELKGFRLAGVISGDDRDVIERRFYAEALGETGAAMPGAAGYPEAPVPHSASGMPVIGLFPSPARPGGSRP
jgi:hypothetical protein